MHRLQVRVALVKRIALAVVVQRQRPPAAVHAHRIAGNGVFVDVVAQEQHRVQVFLAHVPIGAVVAMLPSLAGGVSQPQLLRHRIGRRESSGAPGGAFPVAGHEAVEVPAVRLQAGHFHVDRMGQRGLGLGLAALRDAAELLVVRHFPAHGHRLCAQALEPSVGQQAGPQHDAVMRRRAAGHSEGEGVVGQAWLAPGTARQPQRDCARRRQLQQAAAVDSDGAGHVGWTISTANRAACRAPAPRLLPS